MKKIESNGEKGAIAIYKTSKNGMD